MALTKISGEVIQSGTPITIGVVTATSINVGSAVTIHTGGYLVGNTDLHSTGISVDNVNVSGISTLGNTVVGGATTEVVVTGSVDVSSTVTSVFGNFTSLTASSNSGFHVDGSAPASSFLLGNTGNLSLGNDFTVAGNAGIGTDTPTESFEVNGGDIKIRTTSFAGFTTTRRLYAIGGSGTYNLGVSGGSAIAFIRDGNNNDAIAFETHAQGSSHTEALRITPNATVGIGTTNPQAKLALHGSGGGTFDAIHITNSDTGVTGSDGTMIGLNSSEDFTIWNAETTDVVIAAGNAERLRVDSSGVMTIPGQPMMEVYSVSSASRSVLADSNSTLLPFNAANTYDPGGDFNSTTGVYTVPADGRYLIHYGTDGKTADNGSTGSIYYNLNGTANLGQCLYYGDRYSGNSRQLVLDLNANDTILWHIRGNNAQAYTINNAYYGIYMIG